MTLAQVRAVLVVIGFDVVWLIAAYGGAGGGIGWPGLLAEGVYLTALASAGALVWRDIGLLLAWAVAGFATETMFVGTGALTYTPAMGVLGVPFWVIGLWSAMGGFFIAFWRRTKPSMVVLIAFAIMSPLAYIAGDRIGALTMTSPTLFLWLSISAAYLVALIALTHVGQLVHATQSQPGV